MRYLSLFSGIEAASVAWGPLGWEPVAFCEIEPFPSAVLAHRFPDVPNLGDITNVDWDEFKEKHGAVDVVVGGSPCQSFSIAGNREGLEGASGLMWEYVRAVRDLLPRYCLWENVPGCLSSGPGKGSSGEDFGCLLRALDDLGYGIAWRVLDAQFFGVAQRRRRVFLVGSLGDGGADRVCAVLFEPESLSWDFKTGREERARLAADVKGRSGGPVAFEQNQRGEVRLSGGAGDNTGALAANPSFSQGQGASLIADTLTPWDVQGNRVYSEDGVAPTLCNSDGRGVKHNQPIVALQSDGTTSLNSHGLGYDDTGAAYTLNLMDKQSVAYGFKFHQCSGARGLGFGEEESPTLTADWHNPAVMTRANQPVVCMTDTQSNTAIDEDVGGALTVHSAKDAPVVATRTGETCSPASTPRTGTSSS